MAPESPLKILVVDDEANMRLTLADILQDEGYLVSTAPDGLNAVQLCQEQPFDVILMDVRMPGLDGVEAFRRIRRHQEAARVILMSAYGVDELKQVALEEGVIAFLDKPLDIERALRLIEESQDTAILVVEEDPNLSTSVTHALKSQKFKVTAIRTPQAAVEVVGQIRFDIILIDLQISSMNGLDLYLAIKKLTPTSVAIMIADMQGREGQLAQEAVRQTAYTVIDKPVDLDHLLGLLQKIQRQRISHALRKPGSGNK